ncbi:hypothetical protein BASA50_001291 [Batrachochytrium salamandrivorans]|uniref:Chitin synthase N-terminal domain-containing protein n=1 Tax=Batrachochytrium salamandrivorans TaxID=1357716 RepID=A0ABQ8EW83_9FUNG|nr:hypothetical protein BASA50_001291 [Batrachochytrium salamandrivorans]KAH9267313.1 hypothetical protein BASA83_010047 [Batrachochytrium salamandrivorans]
MSSSNPYDHGPSDPLLGGGGGSNNNSNNSNNSNNTPYPSLQHNQQSSSRQKAAEAGMASNSALPANSLGNYQQQPTQYNPFPYGLPQPSYSSEQPPYSSEQPSFQPPPPPSYDTALAESFQGPSWVVGAPAGSIAPSLPQALPPSLPPDYFDVSIIPVGSILFPQNCPPLGTYSDASIIRSSFTHNIESHDPQLDQNPDALWRFFMSNVQNPQLTVDIHGYHTERKYREEIQSDGTTNTTTHDEDVSDFRIKIEVTRLMSTYWSRIVCVPNKETGPRTLRETLEDYTRSENIWKEIHLTKQPLWDFNELSRALEFAVRQAGYNEKVKISFPQQAAKVSVYSSHTMSKLSRSTIVWVLCILSCLWIIMLPIYMIFRKKVSTKIVCEFPMLVTGNDFYTRHYYIIQDMVRNRSFKTIQAI